MRKAGLRGVMRDKEPDRLLPERLVTSRMLFGHQCQFIVGSSQMSSEPRDFNDPWYVFQLVVRTSVGLVVSRSGYQT